MLANPFIYQSRVRFGDTDASGRIFYVSLLNHFDAAEAEFLRSLACSYPVDAERAQRLPARSRRMRLHGALVYDDLMDIAVTVDRVGGASFTLAFEVSVDGRKAARGKLTMACIDREKQRAIPLPEKLREALTR